VTTTRVLLCRHAEASSNGRICGSLDVELSPRGRRQARILAQAAAALPLAAVYASPLRRALATAGPLAAAHGLEPLVVDALREVDFGELEGRTYAEAEELAPRVYADWMRDPTSVRFPGGEGYAEVAQRSAAAVRELRRRHRGETVAVVGHGGPLRAILAECLGLPAADAFRLEQRPCAVNVVDWHGDEPRVRVLNVQPARLVHGALRLPMRD
jgi:broad specificity phosphatase PhoE